MKIISILLLISNTFLFGREFQDEWGNQYSVEEARQIKADASLGDVLEEPVESVEFGRIAAQAAKQVIVQKVRDAERSQIVEAYLPKINENMLAKTRLHVKSGQCRCIGGHLGIAIRMSWAR